MFTTLPEMTGLSRKQSLSWVVKQPNQLSGTERRKLHYLNSRLQTSCVLSAGVQRRIRRFAKSKKRPQRRSASTAASPNFSRIVSNKHQSSSLLEGGGRWGVEGRRGEDVLDWSARSTREKGRGSQTTLIGQCLKSVS